MPKSKSNDSRLWRIYSLYVRLRDTDEQGMGRCASCGRTIYWKNAQAGHLIPRNIRAVKYHPLNIYLQCRACNGPRGGMEAYLFQAAIRRHGSEAIDQLIDCSKQKTTRNREWYVREIRKTLRLIKKEIQKKENLLRKDLEKYLSTLGVSKIIKENCDENAVL